MHQIAPRNEGAPTLAQAFEHGKLSARQGNEGTEFTDQWRVFDDCLPSCEEYQILDKEIAPLADVDQRKSAGTLKVWMDRCSGPPRKRIRSERLFRMYDHNTDSGTAALSICEALLLALNDAHVLPESEIMGVLKDAAATHERAEGSDADIEMHRAVAVLINRIISGGNSVRRK